MVHLNGSLFNLQSFASPVQTLSTGPVPDGYVRWIERIQETFHLACRLIRILCRTAIRGHFKAQHIVIYQKFFPIRNFCQGIKQRQTGCAGWGKWLFDWEKHHLCYLMNCTVFVLRRNQECVWGWGAGRFLSVCHYVFPTFLSWLPLI